MILGKITAKAQTTIPRAVRLALGLEPGDEVIWEIEGDQVVMSRARKTSDPFLGNFDMFTEWASDADCQAFDNR
jgi:antitoxin PrlF